MVIDNGRKDLLFDRNPEMYTFSGDRYEKSEPKTKTVSLYPYKLSLLKLKKMKFIICCKKQKVVQKICLTKVEAYKENKKCPF